MPLSFTQFKKEKSRGILSDKPALSFSDFKRERQLGIEEPQEPIQRFIQPLDVDIFGTQTTTPAIFPEGRPSPIKLVGGVAKTIGQSIARNIGSAALTITTPFPKEIAEPLRVEDFESFFGQALFETVFGKGEQIKPIETRIAEAEPKIQKFGEELKEIEETTELNVRERLVVSSLRKLAEDSPITLAFLGIMGSVGIDLTPFGTPKNLFRALKNVDNVIDATRIGRQIGIQEDLLPRFADEAVKVRTTKEAESLVTRIAELQRTTRPARIAPEVTPAVRAIPKELEPLAKEARKFKTAEEFVEAQPKFFHGTSKETADALLKGESPKLSVPIGGEDLNIKVFSLTPNRSEAVGFAEIVEGTGIKREGKVVELFINPNAKIVSLREVIGADDIQKFIKENKIDAFREGTEISIVNPKVIKTKSQLTDFFNQVKGVEPILPRIIRERPVGVRRVERELAPLVTQPRRRPDVALREKLRKEQQVAARAERTTSVREQQAAQAIRTRELEDLKRAGQLQELRQRIIDRTQFIARGIREGAIATRASVKAIQQEVEEIARAFEMEKEFFRIIKNIQTPAQLERQMPIIQARISRVVESREVSKLQSNISKQLDKFKPQKVRGVLKGKLTSEGQEGIDTIRNALNEFEIRLVDGETIIDTSRAESKIAQNLQIIEKGIDPKLEARLLLENEALSASGALKRKEIASEVGEEKLNRILDRIKEIVDDPSIGRTARDREAINLSEELARKQGFLKDVTLGGETLDTSIDAAPLTLSRFKQVVGKVTEYRDHHLNLDFWAAKADSFFAESLPFKPEVKETGWWRETRKLQNANREYTRLTLLDEKRMETLILKNYEQARTNRWKFERTMSEKVELGTFKLRDGSTKTIIMTRGQLLAKYAQLQQETGILRLTQGNQWTDEVIIAVNKTMRPEDKRMVADTIDEWYPTIRNEVNPVHERMTGLRIGEEINYSPMPTKFASELPDQLRMTLQELQRRSTTPSAVKARIDLSKVVDDAKLTPLEFDDFFSTAYEHMNNMRRYETFTEPIRDMRRILTAELRQALVQKFGRHFPQEMDTLLDALASGALRNIKNMSWLTKTRSNFTTAVFALSPTRLFKESTSAILWALEETPANLTRAVIDLFAKGKYRKTGVEIFENSPLLQARGSRRNYERDLAINATGQTALKLFTKRQSAVDMTLAFQRAGDKTGIYSFGIPFYHHHKTRLIKEGLSEKRAIQKAVELFEGALKRNQVSGEAIDLGQFQRAGEIGPFFSQFKTAVLGLYRQEENAIRSLGLLHRLGFKGKAVPKESIARNLQKLAIIHAQFMLFQWVADGFRVDPERQKRAFFLGPFGAPIIIGDAITTAVSAIVGADVFNRGAIAPPGLSRISEISFRTGTSLNDLFKGDAEYKDVFEITALLADLKGIPGTNLKNLIERSVDFAVGKRSDPREIIFSDYALDVKGRPKTTRELIEQRADTREQLQKLRQGDRKSTREKLLELRRR